MTYKQCFEAAKRIVAAERALYPGCEDALAIDFGGSNSQTDSKFARAGTQTSNINYDLPASLSSLINSTASAGQTNPALSQQQSGLFSDLMARTDSSLPGYSAWNQGMSLSPTTFEASSNLASMAERNPFTTSFEDSTQSAYEQRARDALSQVASGPEAVRGGTARTGIAQGVMSDRLAQGRGAEVRAAQLQDAGLAQSATNMFANIENSRRGQQQQAAGAATQASMERSGQQLGAAKGVEQQKLDNMGMFQIASDLLGSKKGKNTDNFSGSGQQTNDSFNWGVNLLGGCCFIFLEALNGKLPWYIELARHDYYTGARRHGYKWMANFLVPAMRRSTMWRSVVNKFIVRPFLRYGRWLYKAEGARWTDALIGPWCELWLAGWSVLGTLMRDKKVD